MELLSKFEIVLALKIILKLCSKNFKEMSGSNPGAIG
jgi:hypothetical protein